MSDEQEAGGIELLGQKLFLPTTVAGTVALIGVAVCIAFTVVSVSYIASRTPPENLRQVGNILGRGGVTAIQYQGNKLSSMHAMRQFQFMTPSADSWKKAVERYGSSLGDAEGLCRPKVYLLRKFQNAKVKRSATFLCEHSLALKPR